MLRNLSKKRKNELPLIDHIEQIPYPPQAKIRSYSIRLYFFKINIHIGDLLEKRRPSLPQRFAARR
ncbi:Hypothetical protein FKW44_013702, partial [Caligus rogercresseyi]